jgi:hypothetical protein
MLISMVGEGVQLSQNVELETVSHRQVDGLVEMVVVDVQEPACALV